MQAEGIKPMERRTLWGVIRIISITTQRNAKHTHLKTKSPQDEFTALGPSSREKWGSSAWQLCWSGLFPSAAQGQRLIPNNNRALEAHSQHPQLSPTTNAEIKDKHSWKITLPSMKIWQLVRSSRNRPSSVKSTHYRLTSSYWRILILQLFLL